MSTLSPVYPTRIGIVDTAKLIRKQLKKAFPATKFSVTSSRYSGGSSIHVDWTDGPTGAQVEEITGGFSGAGFDGMIDLKYHKTHWMEPDGSVHIAKREGTTGSVPELICSAPSPAAQLVEFGCDYVLTQRSLSPETQARIRSEIEEYTGESFDPNRSYPIATFLNREVGGMGIATDTNGNGNYGSTLVHQLGNRDYSTDCECPDFVITEKDVESANYFSPAGVKRCTLCGEAM